MAEASRRDDAPALVRGFIAYYSLAKGQPPHRVVVSPEQLRQLRRGRHVDNQDRFDTVLVTTA